MEPASADLAHLLQNQSESSAAQPADDDEVGDWAPYDEEENESYSSSEEQEPWEDNSEVANQQLAPEPAHNSTDAKKSASAADPAMQCPGENQPASPSEKPATPRTPGQDSDAHSVKAILKPRKDSFILQSRTPLVDQLKAFLTTSGEPKHLQDLMTYIEDICCEDKLEELLLTAANQRRSVLAGVRSRSEGPIDDRKHVVSDEDMTRMSQCGFPKRCN